MSGVMMVGGKFAECFMISDCTTLGSRCRIPNCSFTIEDGPARIISVELSGDGGLDTSSINFPELCLAHRRALARLLIHETGMEDSK